jgi:hypothetical protein
MQRFIEHPQLASPPTATRCRKERPIAAGLRKETMCDADLKAPIIQKDGHPG